MLYAAISHGARYTFSGKERDEETGYSITSLRSVSSLRLGKSKQACFCSRPLRRFGARYYNSAYSIWLSVDPMSEKYPSLSPYAYCGNNPVKLVDPNGREFSEHIDKYGNLIAHYDDGDNSVYLHKGGTTEADISHQRETLHKTGGNGAKVGELGGIIDMMTIFENKLSRSATEAKNLGIFGYYEKVKKDGPWDLKNNDNTIWGIAWKYDKNNDSNTTFSCSRFSGATAADVGNYHAGYTGVAANIPQYILWKGAGAAETWKSFTEHRYSDAIYGTIQVINIFSLRSGDREKDFFYNTIGMISAKSEIK